MGSERPVRLGAKHPYRLPPAPIDRGSYAEVFEATHRETNKIVAFKRCFTRPGAKERITREVRVQSQLAHPNIMPILDYDLECEKPWYTMPLARCNLRNRPSPLDDDQIAAMLLDLSDGLHVAHQAGHVHRDISPQNILLLDPDSTNPRWVVADWGMVTRHPDSAAQLTRTGQQIGTPGFDAPELAIDPSSAKSSADVYSLGRVAAWLIMGQEPASGVDLLPDNETIHWRHFVRQCTFGDISRRAASMVEVRALIHSVFEHIDEPATSRIIALTESVIEGKTQNIEELLALAQSHSNQIEVMVDNIALLPSSIMSPWAHRFPGRAATLATVMSMHLRSTDWGDRDRTFATTPLNFILSIAKGIDPHAQPGYLQDVTVDYFEADLHWRSPMQRARTLDFLADLEHPAAESVARALRIVNGAAEYYREPGWQGRSPNIQAVIHATA